MLKESILKLNISRLNHELVKLFNALIAFLGFQDVIWILKPKYQLEEVKEIQVF